MVGIPGYDWQDEEVELTRGKWPGYLALPDLLATDRRDSVPKKASRSRPCSVWGGGRPYQGRGGRLLQMNQSYPFEYSFSRLSRSQVELMTSSSIILGSLKLPTRPKKCKAGAELTFL